MQSIALKPRRGETLTLALGLGLLCVAMFALPALCAPLAALLPLLGCPLVRRRQEPVAWAAAVAPAVASLAAGYHALFSLSLALPGLLPLGLTRALPTHERVGAGGVARYTGAMALALTVVVACASAWLGAPLWQTLAERVVAAVEGSKRAPELLLRAAALGLARLPREYGGSWIHAMSGLYARQLALSLRLTLQALLRDGLPALVVQVSVITGLFTMLRVQRANDVVVVIEAVSPSEKRARVDAPPGFGQLTLPRALRPPLLALMLLSFGLRLSQSEFVCTLGQMGFTLFETLFMLLGAAVLVGGLGARDPDRKPWLGLLAAALYVLSPFVLFLIGVSDCLFHYRSPKSERTD